MLGDTQIERYSRQIILPQVGGKGQEKILRSRVYVDGDGPLAAAALFYLAAAGVGTIGVAGSKAPPVFSALAEQCCGPGRGPDTPPIANTLRRLNPDCTIVTHTDRPDQQPDQLGQQYDLIVATTPALHDVCYARQKPFVWTAATQERGQLFVSRGDRDEWPCLRCLFSVVGCDGGQAGTTLAALPLDAPHALFAGAQQATEALKIIVQAAADSQPKLLEWTVPAFHFTERTIEKNPHCAVCSTPAG